MPPTPRVLREGGPGGASLNGTSEEKVTFYAALVDHLPFMVAHCRPDGAIIFANRAFCRELGVPSDALIDANLFSRIPPDDHPRLREMIQALTPDQPEQAAEHRILLPDGGERWVRCMHRGIFDSGGQLVEIQSSGEVIDPHEPGAPPGGREVRGLIDALRAVAQIVASARDESELLQRACEIVLERTGYRLAWIGFPRQDRERPISLEARAGTDEGYLDHLRVTWGKDRQGQGPGGRALHTGRTTVCRDIQEEPETRQGKDPARRAGLRACIALPLMEGDQAFGVLVIYSAEPAAFDVRETTAILQELAEDLAHGVLALRARQERDRLATILDAIPDFVGIADAHGTVFYLNPAAKQLLGIQPGQESERWLVEDGHPPWAARKVMDEAFPYAARHGVWQGEVAFLDAQDREVPFSQTILAHRDSSGLVQYFSTIARDISELKAAQARLREQLFTSVEIFGNLLKLRSEALAGHSWRVVGHAVSIGRLMGLGDDETNDLFLAGLLHDIGSLSLPEELLKKPYTLMTEEEWQQFRQHPVQGEAVLMSLDPLDPAARIIRHHHEYLDGSGFPDGLSGEAMPIGARILAVANDYDDLLHGRVYGRPLTPEQALDRMEDFRDTLYEARALEALQLIVAAEQSPREEMPPTPEILAGPLRRSRSPEPATPAKEQPGWGEPGAGSGGKKGVSRETPPTLEVTSQDLKPGMVLAADLISPAGMLLLLAGRTLDERAIGKLRSLEAHSGRHYRIVVYQEE